MSKLSRKPIAMHSTGPLIAVHSMFTLYAPEVFDVATRVEMIFSCTDALTNETRLIVSGGTALLIYTVISHRAYPLSVRRIRTSSCSDLRLPLVSVC
jgi:hypothetical protein